MPRLWRFREPGFHDHRLLAAGRRLSRLLRRARASRRFGKPKAAMGLMAAAAFLVALPCVLRLVGLFPAPGTTWLLPSLFAIYAPNVACSISATILGASMMADVVEQFRDRDRPAQRRGVLRRVLRHPEMLQRIWASVGLTGRCSSWSRSPPPLWASAYGDGGLADHPVLRRLWRARRGRGGGPLSLLPSARRSTRRGSRRSPSARGNVRRS